MPQLLAICAALLAAFPVRGIHALPRIMEGLEMAKGSNSMTERSIDDITAGAAFRKKMVERADCWDGSAPLWHGWVIMDAFLAGMDYAKAGETAGVTKEKPAKV